VDSAASEAYEHPAGLVLEAFGLGAHRKAAIAAGKTQYLHHGLGGNRIGPKVAGLEVVGGNEPRLMAAASAMSPPKNAAIIETVSGVHQCDATLTVPTAPTASRESVRQSSPL
jgi:hypothetical protein